MSKTYAQLAREIAALQASAEKQLAIEAKGAIAKINDMIVQYKLTAADLKFVSGAAVAMPTSKVSAVAKGKLKGKINLKEAASANGAKFSDGHGNQWSGRGPRPGWLRIALAAGRSLESFLTSASPAPDAPAPVAAKKPVAKKSVRKVKAVGASTASPAQAVAAEAQAKKVRVKKSAPVKAATPGKPARKLAAPKKAKKSTPARKGARAASAVREAEMTQTTEPTVSEASAA